MRQVSHRSSNIRALALGLSFAIAATVVVGCGGGGGGGRTTPSPDIVSGHVSLSSGGNAAGYTVSFDGSSTLTAITDATGAYSISVPVEAIQGSDTISVYAPGASSAAAIQPIATALSNGGGTAVTQDVVVVGTPPPPPP